ncbi:MAG: M48 family metallopeptidase [Candidatus Melainabacteria bacterium]|nr:M48 family metallopeptidase [Candidatus Melainabacteria bacterium]
MKRKQLTVLSLSLCLLAGSGSYAADKVSLKDRLLGAFRRSFQISTAQEEALSTEMDKSVRKQFPVSNDSRAIGFVKVMMDKLSANAKSPFPITITVLEDSKTVNAFAIPGGRIYVTRGMLNLVDNDAQLAGVLGHELAHVTLRHVSQRVSDQTTAALAVRLMQKLTDKNIEQSRVTNALKYVMFQKFSRDAEYQADQAGLRYMVEAGYDPEGMVQVKDKLLTLSKGSRGLEFLSSHPDTAKRKAEVQELIKENGYKSSGQVLLTPEFKASLQK